VEHVWILAALCAATVFVAILHLTRNRRWLGIGAFD
jgi:hypothetical protein